MSSKDKSILVGIITASHGLKGEVVVKSFTNPALNICQLPLINQDKERFEITSARLNASGRVICKTGGANDRQQADGLKGCQLFCLRADLPQLEDEEFYAEDLKGMKVVDSSLNSLGSIKNILNFGAGDIIEIDFNDGKMELFPFTKEIFPIINDDYVVFEGVNGEI